MIELLLKGASCARISMTDLPSITTKSIFLSYIETMPPPKVETKYEERDWELVWSRLQSGVLGSSARHTIFLIIHEKLFTCELAHRLMPLKYDSPICNFCTSGQVQTPLHRLVNCCRVSEAWNEVRELLELLDTSLILESDHSIVNLYFPKSLRDNAILWIIGEYLDYIENSILEIKTVKAAETIAHLRSKLILSKNKAIPDLGVIHGLHPTGIG